MDVQTQVMNEPQQTFTAQEINNQAIVSDFREKLASIRMNRINLAQQKKAIHDQLRELVSSRNNLLGMFKSEALNMYPELVDKNVRAIINSVSPSHPLYQLWSNYQQKVQEIVTQIAVKFQEFKSLMREGNRAEIDENAVLSQYDQFAESATTTVPTVQDMQSELAAVEVIPESEDSSLIASITAIELVSPEAADLVTLEAAQADQEAEMDMPQEEIQTMMTQAQAQPGPDIKKWGLVLGALALAYVIFGGKE